ncbi:uncharacterized protein CMU_015550 [Cryptosporidium muris RN66]|uniref:Uncharacterized protein n=1 Tax=Cryptosporidium muris (strain RN66) TaxID=441375 RepID=B6ACF4_CRYMR|nr:uncharacterized protein CMU_015550 [Cryptosporidium muris RN66]EEA05808.1 hypothetical protein, conserved [Cryptosporidium muris RN66]|eukprot:XP_002140157.1 hypothetical protein [Cryptosporidium muris RN66]
MSKVLINSILVVILFFTIFLNYDNTFNFNNLLTYSLIELNKNPKLEGTTEQHKSGQDSSNGHGQDSSNGHGQDSSNGHEEDSSNGHEEDSSNGYRSSYICNQRQLYQRIKEEYEKNCRGHRRHSRRCKLLLTKLLTLEERIIAL